MKKKRITPTLISIILLSLILVGPAMSTVETPNYKVIRIDDQIEIRQYNPMIIAEVQILRKTL